MRSGGNPLDLNNLPEDYGREGKQIMEESSNIQGESSDASRCRKKKSGGKDECGKVYECRFCSLKFCKSQALGGHMNRHRQERETETLNRARQLVFSNDNNLAAQGGPHLGLRDMNMAAGGSNVLDPYRPAYPGPRLFPSTSPTILPPPPAPPQGYLYTPGSRLVPYPSSHYPQSMSEYYVSHVLPPGAHRQPYQRPGAESSYTCIGAPLGRDYQPPQDGASRGMDLLGGEGVGQNQEDGLNWGRGGTTTTPTTTKCFDHSSITRFHDGL